MPLDGNPYPMPGVNRPQPFWAMPPYPTLGWNAVPPNHPQPFHGNHNNGGHADQQTDGWGAWEQPEEPQQQV